jgi:hypothetical protein
MPVKENAIARDHVVARKPPGNRHHDGKSWNGPPRRILIIGIVIVILASEKIVPGLSAVPSIAVNEKPIDKPYPQVSETEKPSHQPANEPITQIRDVPTTGVMQ